MFGEFLNIIVRSIKLDKTLYKDNKNFGEAAIYFAGLIMILDGLAGAVAANTIIKTAVAMSGLTAIVTWFVWSLFIYVVGVKLFPDRETKVRFKKVLIGVGFCPCSWNFKIFRSNTRFNGSYNFFNSIVDICWINNFNKTNFKFKIKFQIFWYCFFIILNYSFFIYSFCDEQN